MRNQTQKDEKSDWRFILTGILVGLIIICLWILTYYVLESDPNRGTFGDMFGSVNALFSGLALAGIILTILLQRSELKLQRKELQETRLEFQINRITNVVYLQLEKLEAAIKTSNLKYGGEYTGIKGFIIIELNLARITGSEDLHHINSIKKAISDNDQDLRETLFNLKNSAELITKLIENEVIKDHQARDLRNIFLGNINPIVFKFFKTLRNAIDTNNVLPPVDGENLSNEEKSALHLSELLSEIINNKFYTEKF